MFNNIVATGQHAWAPSQGMIFEEDQGGDGLGNSSNVVINLKEGIGDSEVDVLPDFVEDVSRMVLVVMSQTAVATTVVLKEKLLKPPYLDLKKKSGGLEWELSYSHV
ncbi:hypothetical protein Peur_007968 [Populus x canadensis]